MAEPPDRDSDWVQEVVGIARAAVGAGDSDGFERARGLAEEHGYRARLRDDDVVVLHPLDWLDEDGVLKGDVDHSEALEVEIGGSGDVEEARRRNDELLDGFEESVDDADVVFNARRFAEFCENHHGVAVDDVTVRQVQEFVDDYYPRNVWASEQQEEKLETSLKELASFVDAEEVMEEVDVDRCGRAAG